MDLPTIFVIFAMLATFFTFLIGFYMGVTLKAAAKFVAVNKIERTQ